MDGRIGTLNWEACEKCAEFGACGCDVSDDLTCIHIDNDTNEVICDLFKPKEEAPCPKS